MYHSVCATNGFTKMRFKECYVSVCDIKLKSLTDLSSLKTKPLTSKVNSEKDAQKMMTEPKHPPSAFMFFMEDFRKEMAGKEPQGGVTAMTKLGGQRWRSMTDAEKQPYVGKQSEARLHYDNSMEEYWRKEEERKKNLRTKSVKVVKVIYKDSEEEDSSDADSKKKKYKRPKRRTITKKRYSMSSENSDQGEDSDYQVDDEEDSDYGSKSKSKKAKMDESSDDDSKNFTKNGGQMSEYEKMIERNRAERMAFLKSLKLEEAKAGLVEAVHTVQKKKPQPVKKSFQKKEYPKAVELRKSNRLSKVSVDLSEDGIYFRALREAKRAEREEKREMHIPKNLAFKQAMQFEELYKSYAEDVNIQESELELKFVPYDRPIITQLTLDQNNIAKVTPGRITAFAWYPSSEYLVVAAGSKYGNLGVWNIDSESSPYVFRPHAEGITNLQFNPLNNVQLFTSSHDGSLRYGDMVKHVFNEIYNVANETSCTYFDFLSETTCLVAQRNGQVALVDNRAQGKCSQKKHICHDYSIKTVNVHPVNRNFFITAENKGTVRLWDLRKLQKDPVADITHHKRCVQSAFFSPVTGNSILTTSADDTIALFDSTQLTNDIKMKRQMKHNNYTGRWLSVFHATWLPNSEEAFVIGSMQTPRRIQVYDKNMDVYHIFMHDNLGCVTSINAFHPFRPAVAGANASGKVYIFK